MDFWQPPAFPGERVTAILIFGFVLMLAVLLSGLAHRTVLSTAVLFLVAGFVCGDGALGWIRISPGDPVVSRLAELALVTVLFTDGMKVGIRELTSAWQLPGRALLLGLPLTAGLTAVLCHYLAGVNWLQAFLVGAVLSPTDPVFASAIVGREHIPARLRHLLNVESGVNDGLALPLVLALLGVLGGENLSVGELALELAGGIALGVAIPWIASGFEKTRWFSITAEYRPLFALAVGIVVWAAAVLLKVNEFLAAFAAGITVATAHSGLRDDFKKFGELLAELLKLSALLVFGALISPAFLMQTSWGELAFATAALVLARPLALLPTLWGTRLSWPERFVAAWFGPKGFASVIYAIIVLKTHLPDVEKLFHLIALVIALSIIAHSSTDVPISRWFCREEDRFAEEK